MSKHVIDLTLSSGSDDEPAPKRRCNEPRGRWFVSAGADADDDVVIVEPVRERPHPDLSLGDVDLGEEEVIITAATGQVATRDLAHPRPDCAVERFTASTSISNAAMCPQCFCVVCDVKASECQYWGTGARERDHANARPFGYWRRLREAARSGNGGLVHSEYHGSGPIGSGLNPNPTQRQILLNFLASEGLLLLGLTPASGAAGTNQPGADQDAATAAPAVAPRLPSAGAAAEGSLAAAAPARPCKLKPMPDPCSEPGPSRCHAFELGVLRFGVKAVKGLTIDMLAERVQRFGFYGRPPQPEDYGEKLALSNLFASRGASYIGKYKHKKLYLKMKPLPTPPDDVPVSTERIRKVVVIDCLGRKPATIMGVRVQENCHRLGLLAALAPMLDPPFSAATEHLHLVIFNFNSNNNPYQITKGKFLLDDAFFANCCMNDIQASGKYLVVYRTGHHPAPTWPVAEQRQTSGPGSATETPPGTEGTFYWHRKDPHGPELHAALPAWVVVHVLQYKPPPGPNAPSTASSSFVTKWLTMPLLVPLRKEHATGGPEAEAYICAAVMLALQPYRTQLSRLLPASCLAPVIVLRDNMLHLKEMPSRTSNVCLGVKVGYDHTWPKRNQLQQVSAIMAHDTTNDAYHLSEMFPPVLDVSASLEASRESDANIAEGARRARRERDRKFLVDTCITELISASRRADPDGEFPDPHMSNNGASSIALDTVLLRSSQPNATPRDGILVIKVYTWMRSAPGRISLFKHWDDWSSQSRREADPFPLTVTMQLLSTGMANTMDEGVPVAEAAVAVDGNGSTSTSCTPSALVATPDGGEGLQAEALKARVRAEQQRARRMVASVREIADGSQCRTSKKLVEFMQSGERPAVEQPPGLTVTMRPYQLQSLAFMLELERLVDGPGAWAGAGAELSTHVGPTAGITSPPDAADAPDGGCPGGFRRLFWLPITNSQGQRYWYSPVLVRLAMDVPAQTTGGFLAEEMGLGKTLEVMALTLANPAAPSVVPGTKLPCGRIASHATLVVCAVSLVGQWQFEARKATEFCRIHPYHGQYRIRDPMRLATEFDVVVTTYQTLTSDHFTTGYSDTCHLIKWHRVVFDEGHTLRSGGTKLNKAALELAADRKWICTGTPINNAVDDLLGQFGAINLMPLGKKIFFDSYIKHNPTFWSRNGALLYTLRHMMIRHTKTQNLAGGGVVYLPSKTETDVPVFLTAREQDLYRQVHKAAQRGWEKLKAAGPKFVNSHLFTATSMLMPMRRICSGGSLEPKDLTVVNPDHLAKLPGSSSGFGTGSGPGAGGAVAVSDNTTVQIPEGVNECPICVDGLDQPAVTPCNHWFCRECITGWIAASAHHNCPTCRQPIAVESLRRGVVSQPKPDNAGQEEGQGEEINPAAGIVCESKLRVLLEELRSMRATNPTAKALVFTQFSRSLEWLEQSLSSEGFGHRTITGDMTLKKRTDAINSFQNDPNICVFLLSVRSGAVGINLTAANYVFLLEPCMNPAMEEQAIGRAWRMGQQRHVIVKRFFVKGSVEERIMEVVRLRRSAGGGDNDGSAGAGAVANHRTFGEGAAVAASSLQQNLRISELDLMFREPEFPAADADGAGASS
ncbi:hypothetical protein Vretimale_10963 [Volvox reticuliferus]|uniref:SNF2 super family n=1 Tax=Volvox reticuliferus TaxID=1737510 RepID=A0A8J4CK07_9CHLO|nr:hypothetical protein Vretifemale_12668 [Volvox reticuliferus]GIM06684.1 hypothetical protein Vretimale_10963 [Volvox reticuliferus]